MFSILYLVPQSSSSLKTDKGVPRNQCKIPRASDIICEFDAAEDVFNSPAASIIINGLGLQKKSFLAQPKKRLHTTSIPVLHEQREFGYWKRSQGASVADLQGLLTA